MTKNNFEIRFRTNGEIIEQTRKLWEEAFYNLKRTGFYEKVFLLGLKELAYQIQKGNKKSNK